MDSNYIKAVLMFRLNNILRLVPLAIVLGAALGVSIAPYVVSGQGRSQVERLAAVELSAEISDLRLKNIEERFAKVEEQARLAALDYAAFKSKIDQTNQLLWVILAGFAAQLAISGFDWIKRHKGDRPS